MLVILHVRKDIFQSIVLKKLINIFCVNYVARFSLKNILFTHRFRFATIDSLVV